jgi:hypothetical protein
VTTDRDTTARANAKAKPGKKRPARATAKSKAKPKKSRASEKKAGTKSRRQAAPRKASRETSKRLRPGELDGLVIAHLREKEDALPLGAGAAAKGIDRSSGAVSNCLERLARSEESPVRRASEKPRTYGLDEGWQKTSS